MTNSLPFLVVSYIRCVFRTWSFNVSIQRHKWHFGLSARRTVHPWRISLGRYTTERSMRLTMLRRGYSSIKCSSTKISGSSVRTHCLFSCWCERGCFRSQHEQLHCSEQIVPHQSARRLLEIWSDLFFRLGQQLQCIEFYHQSTSTEWFLLD